MPGKEISRGLLPCCLFSVPAHVVEHPVPHDEKTRDDHVGKQAGTKKCGRDQDFILHVIHPVISAKTCDLPAVLVCRRSR